MMVFEGIDYTERIYEDEDHNHTNRNELSYKND